MPRTFEIPAGEAINTLKRAAAQAGLEIMYPADTVRGVHTHHVHGEFTPLQALDRMLANTPLQIIRDEKTGALTATRVPPDGPVSPVPRFPTTPLPQKKSRKP